MQNVKGLLESGFVGERDCNDWGMLPYLSLIAGKIAEIAFIGGLEFMADEVQSDFMESSDSENRFRMMDRCRAIFAKMILFRPDIRPDDLRLWIDADRYGVPLYRLEIRKLDNSVPYEDNLVLFTCPFKTEREFISQIIEGLEGIPVFTDRSSTVK